MHETLTHKEFFRLNGSLNEPRIEALLAMQEDAPVVNNVIAKIEEGMSCLSDEGSMDGVMKLLRNLQGSLRGDNRQRLSEIIVAVSDMANTQLQSAEYGRSEMREAISMLKGA